MSEYRPRLTTEEYELVKQHRKGSGDTSFKSDGKNAEYSFDTNSRIRTLDDLILACDIDLNVWDIVSWECNKWEVGRKNKKLSWDVKDGVATGNIEDGGDIFVEPLYQVKVKLKPKVAGATNILSAVKEIVESRVSVPLIDIKQGDAVCEKAIKATLSDMHVGLEPNPDGTSLFEYEYNEAVFNENLDKVFQSVVKEYLIHGRFDLLVLDDLGDGLDGFNGLTTRGGHKLDQNMTNVSAFKTYVNGKLGLIEKFIQAGIADKYSIRNVANCNHAGSFGHIANSTIQMILERTYSKAHVDFYILEKFIEHFKYGDHTFILTHGKDSKYMFKGLPLVLNDKSVNFISEYIEHYDIRSKYIHIEKGDLHQIGYQRTKKFDYRNFMSFAPPSAWVQHNFGDAYSGYSIQVVPKYANEISHTDYFFELKKAVKVA